MYTTAKGTRGIVAQLTAKAVDNGLFAATRLYVQSLGLRIERTAAQYAAFTPADGDAVTGVITLNLYATAVTWLSCYYGAQLQTSKLNNRQDLTRLGIRARLNTAPDENTFADAGAYVNTMPSDVVARMHRAVETTLENLANTYGLAAIYIRQAAAAHFVHAYRNIDGTWHNARFGTDFVLMWYIDQIAPLIFGASPAYAPEADGGMYTPAPTTMKRKKSSRRKSYRRKKYYY